MITLLYYSVAVVVLAQTTVLKGMTIDVEVIVGDKFEHDGNVCPRMDIRANGIKKIRERAKALLNSEMVIVENCGDGLWYRVANLNMTDPSEQCPSAWREYNTSGIRACGRPVTSSGSCPATTYSTSHPYSKVCGRVIGYQVVSPDAFNTEVSYTSIDHFYVDGISITHGSNRVHIWTYASSYSELDSSSACPCFTNTSVSTQPPSFVGNNYYCETGNPNRFVHYGQIFADDKLWDGEQCENEGSCCTAKSPPWFSVELSNPTTDDIEVRICGSESTFNEDTPIELLQIYVQ